MNLAIFLLPSAKNERWEKAIQAQCERSGITYLKTPGSATTSAHTVFVSYDIHSILAAGAECHVIFSSNVDDVQAHNLVGGSISRASYYLARAAELSRTADLVVEPSTDEVTLPVVGPISLKADSDTGSTKQHGHPLALYSDIRTPVGSTAVWPLDIFEIPSRDADNASSVVLDLTGANKAFVFGPYIDLPPGLWRAVFRFSVTIDALSIPLHFEWGPAGDSVILQERIRKTGIYEVSLERHWDESALAEFRIYTQHPVFSGLLEPLGCTVTRVG